MPLEQSDLQDYKGSILQELLQNADDAKATDVIFVLDERNHPTDNLISTGLAEYQGPAVLAYSNSFFSEKDWTSLKQLGDSKKIDDSTSTGKFGLGFNAIYDWTGMRTRIHANCA